MNVDLTKPAELDGLADPDNGIPRPVWSDRTRGYFDWEPPRPFLAAPMRTAEGTVAGAIRVTSLRREARRFTKDAEERLVDFGTRLACFLEQHANRPGTLKHYFRMWAAQDGSELARRITRAVPELFSVDSCSFFERDEESRFVLRAAESRLSGDDREHFDEFRSAILDLYYEADGTKTGTCIRTQRPLLLSRSESGEWTCAGSEDDPPDFTTEDESRKFLSDQQEEYGWCEIRPNKSGSLLILPVRDTIEPRLLRGVLRVVATDPDVDVERIELELMQFANGLAHCLGETARDSTKRDLAGTLLRQLANAQSGCSLAQLAEIVAKHIKADAVTLFIREGDFLVARTTRT